MSIKRKKEWCRVTTLVPYSFLFNGSVSKTNVLSYICSVQFQPDALLWQETQQNNWDDSNFYGFS